VNGNLVYENDNPNGKGIIYDAIKGERLTFNGNHG
jgi:hypothetical protein